MEINFLKAENTMNRKPGFHLPVCHCIYISGASWSFLRHRETGGLSSSLVRGVWSPTSPAQSPSGHPFHQNAPGCFQLINSISTHSGFLLQQALRQAPYGMTSVYYRHLVRCTASIEEGVVNCWTWRLGMQSSKEEVMLKLCFLKNRNPSSGSLAIALVFYQGTSGLPCLL